MTIWTARAGILCAAMTGIDEALDDTFLSFTLIYPSFIRNHYLYGVVQVVFFILVYMFFRG